MGAIFTQNDGDFSSPIRSSFAYLFLPFRFPLPRPRAGRVIELTLNSIIKGEQLAPAPALGGTAATRNRLSRILPGELGQARWQQLTGEGREGGGSTPPAAGRAASASAPIPEI